MHIWAVFCKILPVENIGQILDFPLWHNENIGQGIHFLKIGMKKASEKFLILLVKMANFTRLNN